MPTYGEEMLARAEERARRRTQRRRRRLVLLPALATVLYALVAHLGAQHGRLSDAGAGPLAHLAQHVALIGWTLALVVVPLLLALRPRSVPGGAVIALVAGPVLTPAFFGAGGWGWWQSTVIAGIALLVVTAARTRRRLRLA